MSESGAEEADADTLGSEQENREHNTSLCAALLVPVCNSQAWTRALYVRETRRDSTDAEAAAAAAARSPRRSTRDTLHGLRVCLVTPRRNGRDDDAGPV